MQRKYGRGIYSHDTALYLLGYSDRIPAKYTMTFPKGYNAPSLKQENLIIKRVVPDKNIHKLMKYADQLRVKPVGISYGWKLLHTLT